MQSLMEQLQIYTENERPSLIKQIHSLYKYLMDNKSVIVWSPGIFPLSSNNICITYMTITS